MPAPLAPIRIRNPGNRGLNTEQAQQLIETSWATTLRNAEFDENGRAFCRQGWTKKTTTYTGTSPGANNIVSMFCYEDGENAPMVFSSANLDLFYGETEMVNVTGAITAPTGNDWQFVQWTSNATGSASGTGAITTSKTSYVIAVQQGHTPIKSLVTDITPGSVTIGNFADMSGTGLPTGNCCAVGYGRLWIADADRLEVNACGILDETDWNTGNFYFNTEAYWPNGTDYIVAMTFFQDWLIVFGSRSILIYSGLADPGTTFELVDSLDGVGLMSRDAFVNIGSDVIFLSDSGLRSLQRTIQNEKAPVQEMANQVSNALALKAYGNEGRIKMTYDQYRGMILLLIKDTSAREMYMFDVKGLEVRNQFGSAYLDPQRIKVSRWDWPTNVMAFGSNGNLYGGFRNSADSNNAVIGVYGGYTDNGDTYQFEYKSPWIDLNVGAEQQSGQGAFYVIPKSGVLNTVGGDGETILISYAYDYSTSANTTTVTLNDITGDTALWGVAKWGEDRWGFNIETELNQDRFYTTRFGQVFQIGTEVTINGNKIGLQQLDIFLKRGRMAR